MESLISPVDGVQVHGSTLLPRRSGILLAAWFAGPHEGHPQTGVQVLRRGVWDTGTVPVSRDTGDGSCCPTLALTTWDTGTVPVSHVRSSVTPILPGDGVAHWNPVLTEGPDGEVWLFFKRGHRIDQWTTWVCRSSDEGLTWSSPVELVPGDASGGRGPTRQAPVSRDGLWLAPGSIEQWEPPAWDCFIDVSADGGARWEQVMLPLDHEVVAGAGCIQPCLLEVGDELVVLARSTAGRVYRSATRDPFTWPALTPTDLPNNNSGLAAVVLPDGRIACLHNDASGEWGARSRLVLSVSADAGLTWETVSTIVEGVAGAADGTPQAAAATGIVTTGEGEYSYPAMVLFDDRLWATYSSERRSIALVKLELPS